MSGLPFRHRLGKRNDIGAVQKRGTFFSVGSVAVKFIKNQRRETRVAVVAGTAFSPKAVVRNRAKRQLRELVKREKDKLLPGYDLIVMARNAKGKKAKIIAEEFRADLEKCLDKGGLLIGRAGIKNNNK